MSAYTEKPEAIDWNYYRNNISKPNLVEDFKKQFEALSVPYPTDYATAEIEERMKKTVSLPIIASVERPGVNLHVYLLGS